VCLLPGTADLIYHQNFLLRVITGDETWVYYYKLRGHHFHNVPEIQEQSWFILQGIAKNQFH